MGKVTGVKSSVASGNFGLKTPHNTVSAAVCYLFALMDHGAVRISESQLSATSIFITPKTDLIMPSLAFQFFIPPSSSDLDGPKKI